MSTFYADESGDWQPFAGEAGGGDFEPAVFPAADGQSDFMSGLGPLIWDFIEPEYGTDGSYLFAGLNWLAGDIKVPPVLTGSTDYMFKGCSRLKSVPDLNTTGVTSMVSMFEGCIALTRAPMMDTSSVKNISNMFKTVPTLEEIPAYDFSSVTTATATSFPTGFSYGAAPLKRVLFTGMTKGFSVRYCSLDAAAIDLMLTNLGTPAGNYEAIDVRNNPGTATCNPAIAMGRGWKVSV